MVTHLLVSSSPSFLRRCGWFVSVSFCSDVLLVVGCRDEKTESVFGNLEIVEKNIGGWSSEQR